MNSLADQQLLYDYAAHQSDAAFAELVRRHIDLVYSAALRMVGDTHLAEDVTQSAFVALAQNARQLTGRAVLSGWLHRTAQNLAANAVRSEVRRRAREQEAAVMNELLSAESDATWETIAPHLDAALGELNDAERDALLLRYFERKSAREMAAILGTSEDAAQKRVSRAMERLREFFSKRNVTVGASGLAVLISANAVQSAPIGLAAAISTAAVLAGTVVSTSTAIATTKVIAMTTLQKSIIGAALVATVGTGIFEAHQASQLRDQVQTLQQQQAPLAEQIKELQRERDDATNRLAGLLAENMRLQSNQKETELLKLRGETGMLLKENNELAQAMQKVEKQSPSFPTNVVSKSSWNFVGRDTPEDAVESGLWAKSAGNERVFLDGAAPEMTNTVERFIKGNTDEERSQCLINQTTNLTGYQILSEVPVADDEVLMKMQFNWQANGQTGTVVSMDVLKQMDGEWKVFAEYQDDTTLLQALGQ